MKNKILGVALCTAGLLAMPSCSDYLETDSPSTITTSVATSTIDGCQTIMDGAYNDFHEILRDQIFANGLFYALDAAGSDIERHGGEQATGRLKAETFYYGGKSDVVSAFTVKGDLGAGADNTFLALYKVISTMNVLTDGITAEMMAGSSATAKSYQEIYGQAVCMKATCYRELIKYYGDVLSIFKASDRGENIASRLDIYNQVIAELDGAKDYCAVLTPDNKNKFTKQYAYALLGRIALEAAGYQTYRLDVTESSRLEAHPDYTAPANGSNAIYARPTNYKSYYDKAYDAFKWAAENPAGAVFNANDYSAFFTEMHYTEKDNPNAEKFANESIFEDIMVMGSGNSERPYAIGRPAQSSKNCYITQSYGQCRINPAFYYGVFSPKDKRRDISCVVTGSYLKPGNSYRNDLNGNYDTNNTYEVLLGFNMDKRANGAGIACGKWDENRQEYPYIANNGRRSGINHPYMRISEVYLGLAEAAIMKSAPDQNTAKTYYDKTHVRAGLGNATGNLTQEQIIDERGFEFAGEGDRRWTLIRSGFIGKKTKAIKDLTKAMIDGLNASGFYTFPETGNTISNYIYYKGVDPTTIGLSSRLTDPTPDNMLQAAYEPSTDLEATQFPGWRGQGNWTYSTNKNSNIAIKGLFTNITTTPTGYEKKDWGKALVDQENANGFWYNDLFYGWDFKSAPIYLVPFPQDALIGGLTNGYGFTNY